MTSHLRCSRCRGDLARLSSSKVEDSDGRSMPATATQWTCSACATRFTQWVMPRAAHDGTQVVDASTEHWSPDEPVIDFVEPWHAVTDATGLEAELARELSRGHRLYGKAVRAIAAHGGRDDVLFVDDERRVHVVHLTWIRRAEPDPRWPTVTSFRSLFDFAERGMLED